MYNCKSGLPGYLFYGDLQYCRDYNISVVFPTLGLDTAKIIDYIESCVELNFLQKPGWKQIFVPPQGGARGLQTFAMYWN